MNVALPPRQLGLGAEFDVDSGFIGRFAQLRQGPCLELANPLLGHTHFFANLLERQRFLAAAESEASCDDLLLALIEAIEDLRQEIAFQFDGEYGA